MIEIARTHKQYLFDCLFVDKQSAFNSTGPFTRSGHMVRNKLCWDVNCAVGLNKRTITSLAQLSFVLQVPLGNLGPSIIYSVPCAWMVQRSYLRREPAAISWQ